MNDVQERRNLLPFQDQINIVSIDECFQWLAAGWRDFKQAPLVSLSYGALFVAAGLVLTVGLYAAGFDYLIVPLVEGFFLIGPALTVGLHAISRDLEQGRRPSLARALSAWRVNPLHLIVMGLALVLVLIIWARTAVILFAIWFPYTPLKLQSIANAVFFTGDGYAFLAVGTLLGGIFATAIFLTGLTSLPMMLDRKHNLMQAVLISIMAVFLNFRTMIFWAGVIVVVIGAGLLTGLIGLLITLPLIGHASWHAYRGLIKAAV